MFLALFAVTVIDNPNIDSGCFNAGFENISILEIANLVKEKVECEIIISKSNDPRSYRQDSTKLLNSGFVPKYNVKYAIEEIIDQYKAGNLIETDSCYTVKWMKSNGIK